MQSQRQWLDVVKTNGRFTCHQLGNGGDARYPCRNWASSPRPAPNAWAHRIQVGQAGNAMINRHRPARIPSAPWTCSATGPPASARASFPLPSRRGREGVERNIVVTLWDWHSPTAYLHDEVTTDRRNPTVNAGGPLYGAPEESSDFIPVLDPATHTASKVKAPPRDANTPATRDHADPCAIALLGRHGDLGQPDQYPQSHVRRRGTRVADPAHPRPRDPAFCRKGSTHPSALLFPTERTGRNLAVYDPKAKKFSLIDTCFSTHHLNFAYDADNTLWTSGGGDVIGWLNTKMYLETGDEQKSQGWTALILDTNGDGKRGPYTEPDQPQEAGKDMRVRAPYYSVAISPQDGAIWGSFAGLNGGVQRLVPGANPPQTALAEIFYVPVDDPEAPGHSPRGMDIDSNGVAWVSLASGQFASFDRRKCKGPLNGPKATGHHCPEGWTMYPFPGPQFKNVNKPGSAEASYYAWVDQKDTLGLGNDVPIATGNASDALLALKDGKFVTLRVPYPMGFYAKGLDGRIDDPAKGWKGKGLWSTYATRAPQHIEGGKGTTSKVVHFQLRARSFGAVSVISFCRRRKRRRTIKRGLHGKGLEGAQKAVVVDPETQPANWRTCLPPAAA